MVTKTIHVSSLCKGKFFAGLVVYAGRPLVVSLPLVVSGSKNVEHLAITRLINFISYLVLLFSCCLDCGVVNVAYMYFLYILPRALMDILSRCVCLTFLIS